MKSCLLTLILSIFMLSAVIAQPPATPYYTISNGAWTDMIWSNIECGMASCSCTPGCPLSANSDIYVCHIVTANCTIDIGNNSSLTIRNGGDLSVTGGGSITGTGDFVVESGGSVSISGDLDISGNGDLVIDGDMSVSGNLTMSGSGSLCGTGTLVVGGLTGSPCASLDVGFLPVDLVHFSGANDGAVNRIAWVTLTEHNNDYFEILQSSDGEVYNKVYEHDGAGYSNSPLTYFANVPVEHSVTYYKLKQVDNDGSSEEFGPIVVKSKSITEIQLYPNPADDILSLAGLNADEEYTIQVLDISGKEVLKQAVTKRGTVIIPTTHLSEGMYMVNLYSPTEVITQKLVIKR